MKRGVGGTHVRRLEVALRELELEPEDAIWLKALENAAGVE